VTLYLSIEQVLHIHTLQIRRFGWSAGEWGSGSGGRATTFGGEDLYPELAAKAAALMHSLVMNRPFVDGNEGVGAQAALLFLRVNGMQLLITSAELTEVTLPVARGELSAEALAIWLRQRLRPEE